MSSGPLPVGEHQSDLYWKHRKIMRVMGKLLRVLATRMWGLFIPMLYCKDSSVTEKFNEFKDEF